MKVTIVFAFDKKFCPPAYVAIKSLIMSAKKSTKYTIIILSWCINKRTLRKFESLIQNTIHEIIYLQADKNQFKGYPVTRTWSYSVYLRLLLPDLLPQYDKVIYSDVDVFFLDDLSELYSYDIENYQIGGVAAERKDTATQHQIYENYKNEYIYWSGLLLMNLKKMRQEFFSAKIKNSVNKYRNRLRMFDLELLNLTCDRILPLPLRYVMLQSIYNAEDITKTAEYQWLNPIYSKEEINTEKENTIIIHYAGPLGKPWLLKDPPQYYREILNSIPYSFKLMNQYNKIVYQLIKIVKRIKQKLL